MSLFSHAKYSPHTYELINIPQLKHPFAHISPSLLGFKNIWVAESIMVLYGYSVLLEISSEALRCSKISSAYALYKRIGGIGGVTSSIETFNEQTFLCQSFTLGHKNTTRTTPAPWHQSIKKKKKRRTNEKPAASWVKEHAYK